MIDYLYTPVRLKYWQQEDLWNGKYNLIDFLTIVEIIAEEEERQLKLKMMLHKLPME